MMKHRRTHILSSSSLEKEPQAPNAAQQRHRLLLRPCLVKQPIWKFVLLLLLLQLWITRYTDTSPANIQSNHNLVKEEHGRDLLKIETEQDIADDSVENIVDDEARKQNKKPWKKEHRLGISQRREIAATNKLPNNNNAKSDAKQPQAPNRGVNTEKEMTNGSDKNAAQNHESKPRAFSPRETATSTNLQDNKIPNNSHSTLLHPASTKEVVDYLLTLARMPDKQLWNALYQEDVFDLKSLKDKSATCPFSSRQDNNHTTTLQWLPRPPDGTASRHYRNYQESTQQEESFSVIWYEHLSKAGGTSFCNLANQNMPKSHVPRYHCMPPHERYNPKKQAMERLVDGHVGLWSNAEFVSYIQNTNHRIVSNEWNPFDENKFLLNLNSTNVKVVFVTTLRHPLDRLLSAYKFWGVRPNERNNRTIPPFDQFLDGRHASSLKAQVPDWNICNHVMNYNFIVWKFSNGTMPISVLKFPRRKLPSDARPPARSLLQHDEEKLWIAPFTRAIETLVKFDLVLPMEHMDAYSQPIHHVLKWTNHVGNTHVVSQGQIHNTNAQLEFSKEHYDVLWNANRFDMILYHWMEAVYLTRIHCHVEE